MKLSEWLAQADETADAFAKRVGVSAPTISRLARGVNRPDWTTVRKIADATSGAVTAEDWMPPPDPASASVEPSAA